MVKCFQTALLVVILLSILQNTNAISRFLWFHSVPLLQNDVELCLFSILPTRFIFPKSLSAAPFVAVLAFHAVRGGLRWQLAPLYLSVVTILLVKSQEGSIAQILDWSSFALWLLSALLCTVFPSIPLIVGVNGGYKVGVQDLCFSGDDSKFWVRFYYPVSKDANEGRHQRERRLFKYVESIAYVFVQVYLVWTAKSDSSCSISSVQFAPFQMPAPYDLNKILPFVLIALHSVRLLYDMLSASPVSIYAPEGKEVFDSFADFGKLPRFLFSHLSAISVSCIEDAPLDSEAVKRAVLYCHGLGGTRFMYSRTCIELASQGYFVMCPEFGDNTASLSILPDGSVRKYEDYKGDVTGEEYRDYRYKQLEHRMTELSTLFGYLRHVTGLGLDAAIEDHDCSSEDALPVVHPHVRWQTANYPVLEGAAIEELRSQFVTSLVGSSFREVVEEPVLIGHSFGGSTVAHILLQGGIPKQVGIPLRPQEYVEVDEKINSGKKERKKAPAAATVAVAPGLHTMTTRSRNGDQVVITGAAVAQEANDAHGIIRPSGAVLLDPWFFPVSKTLDGFPRVENIPKKATPKKSVPKNSAASSEEEKEEEKEVEEKKLKLSSDIQSIPVLAFHAQLFQWPENLKRENQFVRSFARHLQVHIRDAGHYIFSDIGLLSPPVMSMMKKSGRFTDPFLLQGRLNIAIATFLDNSVSSSSICSTSNKGRSVEFSSCLEIVERDSSLQLLSTSHDKKN